jgi:hypothetical protein
LAPHGLEVERQKKHATKYRDPDDERGARTSGKVAIGKQAQVQKRLLSGSQRVSRKGSNEHQPEGTSDQRDRGVRASLGEAEQEQREPRRQQGQPEQIDSRR